VALISKRHVPIAGILTAPYETMRGCECLYPLIRNAPRMSRSTVPQIGAADLGWEANLDLSFIHREDRTLLAAKSHRGPLQVQKALYPDGLGICHVTVLHPPGGVAGGDALTVAARLGPGCSVCLTTCGAAKWYRCPQAGAQQRLHFEVGAGAALEWLPRENILFDGSKTAMQLDVELASGARFLGWEILCFGRRASGEEWRRGGLRLRTRIRQADRPLWTERANILAGSGFDSSPVGLSGYSVSGTFVAAGTDVDAELLAACRATVPGGGDSLLGVTRTPGILVARYLGHSSQDAFRWFTSVWTVLRPALLSQPAIAPRLWAC
jgi:urease accessory protein